MSTSNFEDPRYCGQCGTQLLPDKSCPNTECIAYDGRLRSGVNFTESTIVSGRLQQSPNTPKLAYSGVLTPPQPVYSTPPPTKSKRNTTYLFVLPFLAFVLIGAGILVGMQIARSNQQGSTSNTPGSPNHQASTPVTGNTTNPIVTPTSAPPATPTTAPVAPGTVICDTTNSDQGWDKWNLVTGWKILNGELLYDGTGNGERMIVPAFCQPTTPNYAVDVKMRIVAACCHFGIIMRGNASSNGYNGYQLSLYTTTFDNVNINTLGGQGSGSVGYSFDNNFHVYRGEVKDNVINFVIDGAKVVSVTDNTYLSSGEVSICCTDTMELDISYLKITAL